ncbi:uncharacterized protein HD556DRAFT_205111 [Suillus plorans]|uniref:Uncharacterized protein n=1 Tax=Suillus plorans TaxID=116603 RepID=A0A9P7A936_9AGAM|nr:uncharacterized protein HD556DRAFT_205111 [Suillus plorans]KAG1784689.1 hypothetical protein HD556DRAFT_205111 [Suillus plorans]
MNVTVSATVSHACSLSATAPRIYLYGRWEPFRCYEVTHRTLSVSWLPPITKGISEMTGLGASLCILWVLSGLAKTLAFTNNRLTSLYHRNMNMRHSNGCCAAVASALARLIGMAVFEIGPLSSLPPSTIGLLCSQLEGHCV